MILGLHVATSGLFDYRTSRHIEGEFVPTGDHQPRIVRVSAVAVEAGREVSTLHCLVKPEGFQIDRDSIPFHGITQDHAARFGLPLRTVLSMVFHLCRRANVIAVWNEFYLTAIRSELNRINVDTNFILQNAEIVAVQQALTNICRIRKEGSTSEDSFRWPKFEEAMRMLLQQERVPLDGIADATATIRFYGLLKEKGVGL